MRPLPQPFRKIRLFVFLALAFFLVLSIVGQNLRWPNPVFNLFRSIPHYDKLGHFLLMGGINLSLLYLLVPKWPSKRVKVILMTTTLVTVLVGLEELSQGLIPSRTLSLIDFGASLLGILTAALLVSIQKPSSAKRPTRLSGKKSRSAQT